MFKVPSFMNEVRVSDKPKAKAPIINSRQTSLGLRVQNFEKPSHRHALTVLGVRDIKHGKLAI